MTTEKEQLKAEIAERDARTAELERFKCAYNEWHEKTEWVQSEVSTGIIGASALGLHRADVMTRLVAELRLEIAALKAQQPSAGVVVGALVSALEGIVHDERVPNEVSQDYAALLIEARRLNPCRAQAVPDGYVLVPVDPTPEMLDRYPFNVSAATSEPMDKEDLRVVYQAMLAAAPSTQQKESGDE